MFFNCTGLTNITLPDTLSIIDVGAFGVFSENSKLSDVYYSGTKYQWSIITVNDGNDRLKLATIHCTDGNILPSRDNKPEIILKLTDGVKYVPYSCHVEGKDYSVSSDTLTYWRYQLVEGTLPSGLSLSVDGVVSGVPKVDGTWNFQVKRTLASGGGIGCALDDDGTAGGDLISCSLKILSNTDAAVKRPNDYNIIIPVGRPCPDDPNHFNKYEYTEEILKIDGPYDEFVRLFIDGTLLKQPDDYTARKGSTVITIHAQTFQHFGEGTHTIATEFHAVNNGNIKVKRVAQNYTLTLGGASNGGSSSSGGSSKPSVNPSAQKAQKPTIPFTDVPLSAWFYEDIVWAYQEGIMQGIDGKRFGPDEKVSQATIVTVLARLAKIDMSQFDGETEPDVPEGQYSRRQQFRRNGPD